MSPFCGATDTPVLNFGWCLLWVSKPEWATLFELVEVYMLHVPWDSPLVWHLPTSWWPVWQPSHLFHVPARHWWDSKPAAIMPMLTVWGQADALPTELSRLTCPNYNGLPSRGNHHKLMHPVGSLQNSDCSVNSFCNGCLWYFFYILSKPRLKTTFFVDNH